jgi:SH3 domain-containing YSC84-like protein 1
MRNPMINRRQMGRMVGLGAGAAVLGGMTLHSIAAQAAAEQAELIRRANISMQEAMHDPQFGNSHDLFQTAKAVMVVPELVKGGFFFGGEGGNGILMAHLPGGGWSRPAFYMLGSASFGLQIGVEVAEVILFVMSERALHAWMRDEVKLGAEAGLTVLVLGSNAEAAATTHGDVDVIAWSRSKGAYAGITLEGSIIKPRNEWNTAYYGHPVTPRAVLQLASR